jgi:hypothetical protein
VVDSDVKRIIALGLRIESAQIPAGRRVPFESTHCERPAEMQSTPEPKL